MNAGDFRRRARMVLTTAAPSHGSSTSTDKLAVVLQRVGAALRAEAHVEIEFHCCRQATAVQKD
jgi:hypothetical protein